MVTSQNAPGNRSTFVSPVDGRVTFGETAGASSSMWTWHSSTGLSTLVSSGNEPGVGQGWLGVGNPSVSFSSTDPGRIYFGEGVANWGSPSPFMTWKANVLSTINVTAGTLAGYGNNHSLADGRVIWGSEYNAMSYKNGVLSTIISSSSWPGEEKSAVDSTGRYLFTNETATSRMFTWHESTGLSTIVTVPDNTGWVGVYVSPFDRFYITGDESAPSNIYTWKLSTGLSTFVTSVYGPGTGGAAVSSTTGRVYFGSFADRLWTWHETTGLSTITTAIGDPGMYFGMTVDKQTGTLYFGSAIANAFYKWSPPVDCNQLGY